MKKNYISTYFIGLTILLSAGMRAQSTLSPVFSTLIAYTGSVQSFTIPSCVSNVTIEVWGAQGGMNAVQTVTGGLGGYAKGVLPVTMGDVLNIYVGGQNGYNGGGLAGVSGGGSPCSQAGGGVGGGASDVRVNGISLTDRVIVAAGGGGAGGDRIPTCGRGAGGGGGAGWYGGGGGAGWPGATSGGTVASGGTQTAGGTGGTSVFQTINNGLPGTFGFGGDGGGETGSSQGTPNQSAMPGGHGGGLSGNNGQHTGSGTQWWPGQSGAGGSSYVGTLAGGTTSTGIRSGNGVVSFTYNFNGNGVVATSSNTNGICPGGSVTLYASNVPTYTWSTGSQASSITVSPNVTTVYTLQGTNNLGCVSTQYVPVIVNPFPVVAPVSSHSFICVGESMTLTAAGASTYTWTGVGTSTQIVVSPSATTVYTVSGTSTAGCVSEGTVIATVNDNVISLISSTAICVGDQLVLSASGGTVYSWSTGSPFPQIIVSPPSNTVYIVTATDQFGCVLTAATDVTVNSKPNVTAGATKTVICKGDKHILTGNGASTYSWSTGATTSSIIITPTIDVTYHYTVTGISAEGCASKAVISIKVNACVSVAEQNMTSGTRIYPNPTSGLVICEVAEEAEVTAAQVYNISGELIMEKRFMGRTVSLDLSARPHGVYLIRLVNGDELTSEQRVIKE